MYLLLPHMGTTRPSPGSASFPRMAHLLPKVRLRGPVAVTQHPQLPRGPALGVVRAYVQQFGTNVQCRVHHDGVSHTSVTAVRDILCVLSMSCTP